MEITVAPFVEQLQRIVTELLHFGRGQLPGIGQLFVNGALNRDYSMVLGLTILVGTLTIAFNAVVDILYAFIDPKIRY